MGHVDEFDAFNEGLKLNPGDYMVKIVPVSGGAGHEEKIRIDADKTTVVRVEQLNWRGPPWIHSTTAFPGQNRGRRGRRNPRWPPCSTTSSSRDRVSRQFRGAEGAERDHRVILGLDQQRGRVDGIQKPEAGTDRSQNKTGAPGGTCPPPGGSSGRVEAARRSLSASRPGSGCKGFPHRRPL